MLTKPLFPNQVTVNVGALTEDVAHVMPYLTAQSPNVILTVTNHAAVMKFTESVEIHQGIVHVQAVLTTELYLGIGENQMALKSGDTTGNAVASFLFLTAHPVNVTRTGSFLAALARMVCVWMACLVACAMIVLTTGLSAKYGDQVRIVQWRDSAVDL